MNAVKPEFLEALKVLVCDGGAMVALPRQTLRELLECPLLWADAWAQPSERIIETEELGWVHCEPDHIWPLARLNWTLRPKDLDIMVTPVVLNARLRRSLSDRGLPARLVDGQWADLIDVGTTRHPEPA